MTRGIWNTIYFLQVSFFSRRLMCVDVLFTFHASRESLYGKENPEEEYSAQGEGESEKSQKWERDDQIDGGLC